MARTYVTERRAYSAERNNNAGEPSEVSSLLSRDKNVSHVTECHLQI